MKKLINLLYYKHTTFLFCVEKMVAQEGAEIRVEENPQQGPPGDPRQNSDGSSPMDVLETMRNLIVKL